MNEWRGWVNIEYYRDFIIILSHELSLGICDCHDNNLEARVRFREPAGNGGVVLLVSPPGGPKAGAEG